MQNAQLIPLLLSLSLSGFAQDETRTLPGYHCESVRSLKDFDPNAMAIPVVSFTIRNINTEAGSGKVSFLYGAESVHQDYSTFRPDVLENGKFKKSEDLRPKWVTNKAYAFSVEINDPNFQASNPECQSCKAELSLIGGGEGTEVYEMFNHRIRAAWNRSGVSDKSVLQRMEKQYISGWYGTTQVRGETIDLVCDAPIVLTK